jgi:hypothetical protein
MLNRRHIFKTAAAALAVACMAASVPASAQTAAAATTTGKVRLRFVNAGFIIGVAGGEGALTFRGQTFPLRIGGVSAGTFGASGGTLTGRALNLRNGSDIAGTYAAVGAGVAIAGGARVIRMQNSSGVILELKGAQMGFEANAGLSGFSLQLQ